MTDGALRVLQLNHADLVGGGAAIAGFRLHRQLRAAGVDSRLLVGTKVGDDPHTTTLPHPRLVRAAARRVERVAGLTELAGVGAYRWTRGPALDDVDVVHAHAVHGDWFSYPALATVAARRPTVMTLHDMWPFTGHCSFAYECERWRTGCGRCPHPETFPAVRSDGTAVEWRLKRRTWARTSMALVTPSRWLADLVAGSTLGHLPVHHVPHGIDQDDFAPGDRAARRAALGIAEDEVVLMFAATALARPLGGALDRKGGDLLVAALDGLPQDVRRLCRVLLMGAAPADVVGPLEAASLRVLAPGYVADDPGKATLYAAADLFVFPTRADNAPLVVLEALACGTPVASFDVGGVGELVRPGETGFLVPAGDVDALRAVLTGAVRDRDELARLRAGCRAFVERHHTVAGAVAAHLAVYEDVRR